MKLIVINKFDLIERKELWQNNENLTARKIYRYISDISEVKRKSHSANQS